MARISSAVKEGLVLPEPDRAELRFESRQLVEGEKNFLRNRSLFFSFVSELFIAVFLIHIGQNHQISDEKGKLFDTSFVAFF